jgi:RNA polymerase sigma-70 factor (ECF subfamily)
MDIDSADRFLVEEIRAGEATAWKRLIERYHGRLLAFARARTPTVSDAEDIVQEAFVGFIQSLPNFDASRSLETSLFTILRYKLVDLLRQKKLSLIGDPGGAEDWWDRLRPGSDETPSGVIGQAEMQQRLQLLLADLLRRLIHELRDRDGFEDLQVIELLFYGGKRNLDVAELMEIDQKAVAGIKFRAIQKLRGFLEQSDDSARATLAEGDIDVTVAQVWRAHRLTCLKRSTLGAFLLEVLEEPWKGYTQFHLDVVGCPMCTANLADLQHVGDHSMRVMSDHVFQSSAGFLSRVPAP